MSKIFSRKIAQSKVNISDKISLPHKEQLLQASGVITNYLKDKKCTVNIKHCPLYGVDHLEISALNNSKKVSIQNFCNQKRRRSFLRKIYEAIEIVTNNVTK